MSHAAFVPHLPLGALPQAARLAHQSSPAARPVSTVIAMAGTPKVPYKAPGQQNYEFIDIWNRLNKDRIIFVGQDIDNEIANQIIATLLYLEQENDKTPVSIYFNCPGGLTEPGLAVFDCMQAMKYPISTLNLGFAAYMGAFLVGAGTKGRRLALPNARFLLQAPSLYDKKRGQASEVANEVAQVLRQRDKIVRNLSAFTGRPEETIKNDLKRDLYLTAFEAREYGLIDQVLTPKPKGEQQKYAAGLGMPMVSDKPTGRTGIW